MNGKEYALEAMERITRLVPDLGNRDGFNGGRLLEDLSKACDDLKALANKPSLRTKDGTTRVMPIVEAAQNVEDALEEAGGGEDLEEVQETIAAFMDAVEALKSAMKDRTVVLT